MSRLIAILNMKGGSGKSTLATNLARGLQEYGEVKIADADPQGTALRWARAREGSSSMPSVQAVSPPLREALRAFDTDYVVVDGVAKARDRARQAVQAADLVLIPVRPSGADLWASEWLISLVKNQDCKAALVISQAVTGTNLAEEIGEVVQNYGLPVLNGRMGHRIAYAEALSIGSTVLDHRQGKAADEVRQITDEVIQLLQ